MALTILQKRLVNEIIAYVRREAMPSGTRLPELRLAKMLGTARTPIQGAMAHLKKRGIVQHIENRGYFLRQPASALRDFATELSATPHDPVYQRILEIRLARKVPDVVTESELVRLIKAPRGRVRKALAQILQEGWIERRPSQGWRFLSMIDSNEAYRESYDIRLLLEPQAILSPTFKPDRKVLEACRKRQEFITKESEKLTTPMERFDANAYIHESIAEWSGNRFILQTIRRLNQLRRLVGYRQAQEAIKRRDQQHSYFNEHMLILDKIAENDFLSAASLMREHLQKARDREPASVLFS